MPNKDGTGPMGKGPMTGRKNGPCNPKAPKNSDSPKGRGLGCNMRGRMGSKD